MGDIKILIAEDEAIAAEDLSRSLDSLGYQVVAITTTAEDSVKKAGSLLPDLILMDIRLQGEKSGIDAAKEIQRFYNIPIIYLTALADNATLQKAKDSSPYGFILKPFQIRELIGVIETTIHRHQLEIDLKAKQAWLSTTLNSIGDGVISTDTNSLVTFMNPMAESLTGWTRKEAMGKPLKEIFRIVNEFTKQTVKNPVDQVLREGRIIGLTNYTLLVHKDGRRIPIDDSGSPIRDEHDKITGVILVFKDTSEKRKAENERRIMMERYQSIINSNHNAIYLLDTELNYLLMNQAYFARLGFKSSEQLIGKAYSEFHSDKNTKQFLARIETLLKSGYPVNYEYRSDRDGRNFMRTLSPIRNDVNGSIQAITVISTDISERRTAERSLGISETRFSTVFKNSPLGIVILRNLIFDDMNPAFCKMLGYTKHEMKQLNIKDITHPDDNEKDAKYIRELMTGKSASFQREKRYLKKSGDIVWAKTSVTLIKNEEDDSDYTLAIIEDISEKRKTEEALKESEKKYAAIFKSAADGFIFLNKKGIVLDVNDAFTQITDISRDQIVGKRANTLARKFVKPKDLPWILKNVVTFLSGRIVHPYELEYKDKRLEIRAAIGHESDGYTTTIRDITAQKHAEDQIKSSLQEKEVLLKEIHHRVKNNLQIIQSLLGLQTQFIRDPKDLGLIKESQDRVRSIALIHENLYQSPNLAEIDFAEYIRNLAYALYRSYKVNMDQIQLDIKIKDIKFSVDRAVPCGLIINELLTNALKYAFPPEFNRKGLIEIKMKRFSKNEVELIFSDNGIGIPDDKVEKGTESLGLTLVKLLAEKQLKGKIKVDYKKGTKYTMILNLLA